MLWEHSPRAYYVRNFLLNIMGNDRESIKQRLETVFFVAFKDCVQVSTVSILLFSTSVSLAVKAVH